MKSFFTVAVRRTRSSILSNRSIQCAHLNQKRFMGIPSNSWAKENLIKQGVKLDPVEPKNPKIEITPALLEQDPSENVKRLVNEILSLNVIECHQLVRSVQGILGIKDEDLMGHGRSGSASPGTVAVAPPAEPEPVKVKEAFDIKITAAVPATSKVKVIKEVRTITGLGLKEVIELRERFLCHNIDSKELVEKAPVVVKVGVKKDEADALKKLLIEAGAEVELL